ncbi:hypothetical protein ABKN59_010210 [Abortiporus biennis]
MGLSGRKVKQRIGHDPRNLSWADDASKFGAAYMSKLGWTAGTGLGTSGEGRTTHIKVHQKLDMLGIGAQHTKDPNGIAWKQNRDFENLLKRLNGKEGDDGDEEELGTNVQGFARAKEDDGIEVNMEVEVEVSEESGDSGDDEGRKEKKKRKRVKEEEVEDEGERKKKKSKKSKDEKSAEKADRKKKKKEKEKDIVESEEDDESKTKAELEKPKPPIRIPHRAHRARFIAHKRMALSSSAAMDEILGISRSGTSTPLPSTSMGETSSDSQDLKLHELKTSSKSVMDYFKEKLLAKSNAGVRSSTSSTIPTREDSTVPESSRDDERDDYDDRPRGGLGLGASRATAGLGSRLRMETTFEEVDKEAKTGIGASSRIMSMFRSAATSFVKSDEKSGEVTEVRVEEEVEEDKVVRDENGDEEKKRRKKEKTAEKERRKLKKEQAEAEAVVDDENKEKRKEKKDKKGKRKAEDAEVESEKSDKHVEVKEDDEKGLKKRKKEKEDGKEKKKKKSRSKSSNDLDD